MTDPAPPSSGARVLRVSLVLSATILVVLLLDRLESIFVPLTFALLVIAIIWPVQRALQQRMPKLVALAFSTLLTFLFVTIFVSLCAWAFARIARDMIALAPKFQALYEQLAAWLEGHGIVMAGLWTEYFNMASLVRILQQLLATLNSTLSFSLVVIVYVVLGLLEVDLAARRLGEMTNRELGCALRAGIVETAGKLRRYMGVRTLMSAATGGLVWAFAYVTGLPHAMEWGIIAFALNYIPFIGPFIATILPTLFAVI
jgi:AI-2 transport protein TqsA